MELKKYTMNTAKVIENTINCVDSKGTARGWIIYYDKDDRIKEIKSLFKPKEYTGSRYVHSDQEIIENLKDEKIKTRTGALAPTGPRA